MIEGEITRPEFPVLYKYRYFDEKGHHIKLLKENTMYMSSPSDFNDPFDCCLPVSLRNETKKMRTELGQYLQNEYPNTKRSDRREHARNFFNSDFIKDPSKTAKIFNSTGIFCLSRSNASLLSWAHYSSAHTGYCIGISTNEILNKILELNTRSNESCFLLKAIYLKKQEVISISNSIDNFFKLFQIKSSDWQYEAEVRVIAFECAKKVIKLPPNAIKRVIMGCKISPDNKEYLIEVLKQREHKPILYQAEQSPTEFKLLFKRVEY